MEESIRVKEDTSENDKPIMLFGRDIRKIPCFKNSLFYGLGGGLAASLISFMLTSKLRMSSHIGLTCMWVCVFGYWFPCRLNYENTEITIERLKNKKKNTDKAEK